MSVDILSELGAETMADSLLDFSAEELECSNGAGIGRELGLDDWDGFTFLCDGGDGGASNWVGGGLLREGEVATTAVSSPSVIKVPKLPWRVKGGGQLEVHDFGDIGSARFDTKKNLIPPGYKCVHEYKRTKYMCEVVCVDPEFEYKVTNMESGTTYSGEGVTMSALFKRIREESNGGSTVSGPLAFGLANPKVSEVLRYLAGVACDDNNKPKRKRSRVEVDVVVGSSKASSAAHSPVASLKPSPVVSMRPSPVVSLMPSPVVVCPPAQVQPVAYVDFDDALVEAETRALQKAFMVLWRAEVSSGRKPSLPALRFMLGQSGLSQPSVATMRALAESALAADDV